MDASDDRSAAWAAVHDPQTDATALFRIAQRFPEFGEAIGRHPNCYDGLRQWFAAAAAEDDAAAAVIDAAASSSVDAASAPELETDRAPSRPRALSRARTVVLVVSSAGALLLVGLASWAAVSLGGPAASPVASDSVTGADAAPTLDADAPRALAGPPVYVGEELEWFLPAADQVRAVLPEAGDFAQSAEFGGIGESEGVHVEPRECSVWFWGDTWAVVGVRTQSWEIGSVTATQFPTSAEADALFRSFVESASSCSQYDALQYDETPFTTSTVGVVSSSERALATRETATGPYGGESVRVIVVEGNVTVEAHLDSDAADETINDVRRLLERTADQARETLTERIGYR